MTSFRRIFWSPTQEWLAWLILVWPSLLTISISKLARQHQYYKGARASSPPSCWCMKTNKPTRLSRWRATYERLDVLYSRWATYHRSYDHNSINQDTPYVMQIFSGQLAVSEVQQRHCYHLGYDPKGRTSYPKTLHRNYRGRLMEAYDTILVLSTERSAPRQQGRVLA